MTTKEKQGFGLYFLLAFGLAWLCQVGGCMALLQKQNAVLYQLALVATMLCPLLAVLLVQKVFLRQPTGIGWKVPVSYTHLTLPTIGSRCRSRWSPYH